MVKEKQSVETDPEIVQMLDLLINLVVIGFLEEENENGYEKLFGPTVAKLFPKLMKNKTKRTKTLRYPDIGE